MKKSPNKTTTIIDIAEALGMSISTVHRALRDHPNVKPATKNRVLKMAKRLDYKPNLAARLLSSKRTLRISVNTLQGSTSFWDEVRAGIEEESRSLVMDNAELEFRTYPALGDSEEAAFESALQAKVDGIIAFPGGAKNIKGLMKSASEVNTPVVFVATDAPGTKRLSVVAVDTNASGFLAADLMGRILGGDGRVAITMFDAAITEHAEKAESFKRTLARFYPGIHLEHAIEDHGVASIAYEKTCALLSSRSDLGGIYVTTEASIPVISAARDLGALDRLTIITTDLFPSLAKEIERGNVTATIYQRPRTQGKKAFRVLYDYLVSGNDPSQRITLAPHLIMRGNIDAFMPQGPVRYEDRNGRV